MGTSRSGFEKSQKKPEIAYAATSAIDPGTQVFHVRARHKFVPRDLPSIPSERLYDSSIIGRIHVPEAVNDDVALCAKPINLGEKI